MEKQRIVTIPFVSTVDPRGYTTVASNVISTPFEILRASFSFPARTLHNLRYYLFHAEDDHAPTDALPPGTNILQDLVANAYIIGENGIIKIETNFGADEANSFLKVCAVNNNFFTHTVSAYVTIQLLPGR